MAIVVQSFLIVGRCVPPPCIYIYTDRAREREREREREIFARKLGEMHARALQK